MRLSNELAKQAKAKGICDAWHSQLQALQDKEAMVDMYLRGIDFCLSNDYPKNDYIRKHFKGMMEKKGVFLDDNMELTSMRKCVCLGSTTGQIEVNGYEVSEIYLKHESEMVVIAKGNSFVMVDIFDNARVEIKASEKAKVCVNHYGGTIANVTTDDAVVKIREKNKKTY